MKLDLRENQGVSILVMAGQLVVGADEQFREAIDTLLAADRVQILLDLTGVDYIDSAGIGELVASHRTVERFGGALKILRPGDRILETLTLTQLLPIFEVFHDEDEAVASFVKEGHA